MKKIVLFLSLIALSGIAPLSAVPINTCNTPCSSSCGDCKIVKTFCVDPCECVVKSRTHFTDHELFFINSPERIALWRDLSDYDSQDYSYDRAEFSDRSSCRALSCLRRMMTEGAFQAVLFGGKTTDRGRMASYFTPFCTNQLLVKEQIGGESDAIGSVFFNVATNNTNFESIIRFAPEQSVIGLGLSFKQRFAQSCSGRAFEFGIAAPIERVKNTMNFSEEIINDGGGAIESVDGVGPVANMREAFRQASWACGKIDCSCPMTKTRLAFLELTLGYEFLNGEHCNAFGYVGVLAPTGNSVKSEFLFQPVVGYGKHTGIMLGTSANVMLWANETEEHQLNYYFHLNGMYLTSHREHRLIDVVNKPWSRFMRVYLNRAQAEEANALAADFDPRAAFVYTPGVNIFCQDVKVKPGFQRTYTNAFVYVRNGFTGEVGYTFFSRPAECVQLACPWKEESAFLA